MPVTAQQLSRVVASLEQKLLASKPSAAPAPVVYLANAAAPTTTVASSVASSVSGSVGASAGVATVRSPAGIAAAAAAAEPKAVPLATAVPLAAAGGCHTVFICLPPLACKEWLRIQRTPSRTRPCAGVRGNAPTPYSEPAAAINALLQRLTALDTAASRPASAPVRYNTNAKLDDTASVASWSADAYGKSKTPGWYHTSRKQLYQRRSKLQSDAPEGVYTSHTKYADEAFRIKSTGRLAF